MLKAVKIRIYPNTEQVAFLNQQFGAVRKVYNKSLAIIKHQYKYHNKKLKAAYDIKPLLAIAKKSRKYYWLKDFDSISLQQACRNLDAAFINFFKKIAGFPQFKTKHERQSSYHCMGIKFGCNWIKIPKLKSCIKAKIHRQIEGELKSITISRSSTGKYYAALLFNTNQVMIPLEQIIDAEKVLGLDVGIKHLFNDSNGKKQDNPRYLERAKINLRRKQKNLSRKTKGSKGRAKARLILAKSHEKVVNARNDFQHKLTRQIVDENQAIIVETLKVKNMIKNHKLARHIADASWYKLTEKLKYKAIAAGKHFVTLDQWFASSKICSGCDYKMDILPLIIRYWDCPNCKAHHDRDLNAALNIKKHGILKLKADGTTVTANGGLHKTDYSSAVA